MCIVIDINTISCVFNEENSCHDEFEPVENWILKRNGKIVYGGRKYQDELRKMPNYLRLFRDLSNKGKVVPLNDDEVDIYEEEVKLKVNNPKCNDPHIIAIIAVSKCKVLCSIDIESYKYIDKPELYPKGVKPPKFYSRKSCKNLLVDDNIIERCK